MTKTVNSKVIVIDLDDTICFPNHGTKNSDMKYGQAQPNWSIINRMKELASDGWEFEIHSARRMVTHQGDVNKIEADVGNLTRKWLELHEVPYTKLIFGKPYAQYYVDDKALSLNDFLTNKL